jgi:hypothetical protein
LYVQFVLCYLRSIWHVLFPKKERILFVVHFYIMSIHTLYWLLGQLCWTGWILQYIRKEEMLYFSG